MGFTSLDFNGRLVEALTGGHDSFWLLPPGRQRETGRLWVWSRTHDGYWHQMIAAMPHIASCPGSVTETLSGEPLRRCSFLLKPQRTSLLARLGKRAEGHALRKVREHSTALELALFDGVTRVVAASGEYSDFGVGVGLAAPSADQVLGYPAE